MCEAISSYTGEPTFGVYTVLLELSPECTFPLPVGTWKPEVGFFAIKLTIFRHYFFLESIKTYSQSIGSHTDKGGTGSFRQFHLFHLHCISENEPIDSRWVWLSQGNKCCRNIVDFMAKKPTSGFEVPTGSGKLPHEIVRVELYTTPRFHPNRMTRLRG